MVCIFYDKNAILGYPSGANKTTVHWEELGEEEEPLDRSPGRFAASAGQLLSAGEESDFF